MTVTAEPARSTGLPPAGLLMAAVLAAAPAIVVSVVLVPAAHAGDINAAADAAPLNAVPTYANAGFMAAVRARPAGAEFRDSAALAAATEAKADAKADTTPNDAKPRDAKTADAARDHAANDGKNAKTAKDAKADAKGQHASGTKLLRAAVAKVAAAASRAASKPASPVPAAAPAVPPVPVPAPATAATAADAAHGSATPQGDAAWPRLTGPALAKVRGAQAQWSAADVALAKARCSHILRAIDVEAVPESPLRDGECGAPAPLRVTSIGKNPKVVLSPAPLLTCDMALAVHDWMKKDVQPAARKTLRSEIVQIEIMSDYSCRNAYGRARTRLSQHGYANALDVRSFATAKSEQVSVLDNWGLTGREIAALHARQQKQIAAKPTGGQQPGAHQPGTQQPGTQHPTSPATQPVDVAAAKRPTFVTRPVPEAEPAAPSTAAAAVTAVGALTRSTLAEGITVGRAGAGAGGTALANPGEGLGLGMSRLGGPKPAGAPARGVLAPYASLPADAVPPGGDARKAHFLRLIHASACRTFGTVLGPEANNAHRNHLHLDMAMRATGSFCE